jgi:hypothetical protein
MAETCDAVGLALGVPTYYQTVQIFSLAVCCLCCWKGGWTLAPKDESFFNVIGRNYQVPEKEDDDENEEEEERRRRRGGGETTTNTTTTTYNNNTAGEDLEDPLEAYRISVSTDTVSKKGNASEMVAIALEDDDGIDVNNGR